MTALWDYRHSILCYAPNWDWAKNKFCWVKLILFSFSSKIWADLRITLYLYSLCKGTVFVMVLWWRGHRASISVAEKKKTFLLHSPQRDYISDRDTGSKKICDTVLCCILCIVFTAWAPLSNHSYHPIWRVRYQEGTNTYISIRV